MSNLVTLNSQWQVMCVNILSKEKRITLDTLTSHGKQKATTNKNIFVN